MVKSYHIPNEILKQPGEPCVRNAFTEMILKSDHDRIVEALKLECGMLREQRDASIRSDYFQSGFPLHHQSKRIEDLDQEIEKAILELGEK